MKYNFDEIIPRVGTHSLKFDADCSGRPLANDAVSMWVADMDFACAPPIIDALRRATDNRIFGYTDWKYDEYFSAVCGYYERRHRWHIDPKQLVFTHGVVSALNYIVAALSEPGDGIIVQPPVYPPFMKAASSRGRVLVENPLIRTADGGWEMNFDDLAKKAAQPQNKMLIFCSPHNPVGRVWREDELKKLYEICHENGVLLVSDEIHCDIVRRGLEHIPLLREFPNARDIIVSTAPTKTFNIAGFQTSHTVVPDDALREKLERSFEVLVNPLAAAAVIAALSECDEWADEVNEYIDGNFDYFTTALESAAADVRVTRREGTYLAWADFSAYRSNSMDFERELADKHGLIIEAGSRFGTPGEGFMRINLACPRSTVETAVKRLTAALGL